MDAITASTITSRAYTEAVKNAVNAVSVISSSSSVISSGAEKSKKED